jgi:hypothetical protein
MYFWLFWRLIESVTYVFSKWPVGSIPPAGTTEEKELNEVFLISRSRRVTLPARKTKTPRLDSHPSENKK